MALYIKDPEVVSLLEKYVALSGAKSKTEAVRKALIAQIAVVSTQESLADRVSKIQQKVAASGFKSDGSSDKPLMDEMWGEA